MTGVTMPTAGTGRDIPVAWTEDSLIEPEPWMQDALCAQTDPDVFFPEKGGTSAPAKSICAGCDVRPECLHYAVRTQQRHGVWGGTSERDRAKLAKQVRS